MESDITISTGLHYMALIVMLLATLLGVSLCCFHIFLACSGFTTFSVARPECVEETRPSSEDTNVITNLKHFLTSYIPAELALGSRKN